MKSTPLGDSSSSSSASSCSEDETTYILKRAIPASRIQGIPCSNGRCDQEIVCVNQTDYYCSRDCYHSKLERDRIGETSIQLRRMTINGRGGTGLLLDKSVLDHLKIRVDNGLDKRTVTVYNSGANASKWKGKLDQKDSMKKRQKEDKQRLQSLLNLGGGGDDDTSSSEDSTSDNDDDNDHSIQEADEEIQTILSTTINSSICPIHPPMEKGKQLQGYVINIVSPWELYVQTEEMVLKTHEIDQICNRPEGIDPLLVLPLWLPQIGSYCTAKYEDKLYRAKILEKVDSSNFKVKFVDYGNISLVEQSAVSQLNPEITLIPRQYFFLKLSNVKPLNDAKKWGPDVCQFLTDHLDGGVVQLEIESVERGVVHWGKLCVLSSLSGEVQGDIGTILVERQLTAPDSFFL